MTKGLFGTKNGYRNISVDGKEYRWKCGNMYVDIRNAENQRVSKPQLTRHELKGVTDPNQYVETLGNGFIGYAVKPKDIEEYIRENKL